MPDKPTATDTKDLANTEYDAERWARVYDQQRADPNGQSGSAAGDGNKGEAQAERPPADKS